MGPQILTSTTPPSVVISPPLVELIFGVVTEEDAEDPLLSQ